MNAEKGYDSPSFRINCDILNAGRGGYTRAWNRYLTRSAPVCVCEGGADFTLWMNQQLPLFNKNPFVPYPYVHTYVGCVAGCHDNSPLLPAYLGLALCLLTGARQPRGLHRCSPVTVWWSFIANSSVSKSLLLSSLFWFMYSLIYLCMWMMGREEERRGGEGAGGKKKRKTATTTILAATPEGTPAEHLPFKSCSSDRRSTEADNYKAPPPMSIETACVFCSRRQKTVPFNCTLALWKGLNGAAHRCGNYKKQRQAERRKKKERTKERTAVCYCRFRILHRQQWSQSCGRGLCAQFVRLSSSFGHLWIQQRKAWQRPCEHRYPGTSPPPARRRPTWRSAAWMCLHIPLSSKLSIAKLSGSKQH